MAADGHIAEEWREGMAAWLSGLLTATLSARGFEVWEAQQEGERPRNVIVTTTRGVERQSGMPTAGRIRGAVVLQSPHDDWTLAQHRENAVEAWSMLKQLTVRPGPIANVYLHDTRLEDRMMETVGGERLAVWELSAMCSLQGIGLMEIEDTFIVG